MLPSPCHRSRSHASAAGTATTVGVLLPGQSGQDNEAIDVLFWASVDLETENWGNAEHRSELSLPHGRGTADETRGYTSGSCSNVTRTFCARSKPSLPTRERTDYSVIVVERDGYGSMTSVNKRSSFVKHCDGPSKFLPALLEAGGESTIESS